MVYIAVWGLSLWSTQLCGDYRYGLHSCVGTIVMVYIVWGLSLWST